MFYFTNEKNNPRDLNFSWELLRTNLLAVPLEMLIGAPRTGFNLQWDSCLKYVLINALYFFFDWNCTSDGNTHLIKFLKSQL